MQTTKQALYIAVTQTT